MTTNNVTYQNSGYFSSLINDYLNQNSEIESLYNKYPNIDNFEHQIREKQKNYPELNRTVLVNCLQSKYKNFAISSETSSNIELLKSNNTFTVTTGHQLNLFTGPLYFIYKIVSTINLSKQLKNKYPYYNFVPIYWMATEDHDFEEINYFNFKGKKIFWNKDSKGAVGRLSTEGLDKVFEVFQKEIGLGKNAETLKKLFKNAYLEHDNLSDATFYLANELFKEYGLVILEADNVALKKIFSPYIENELINKTAFNAVLKTNEALKNYKTQVNPREINLFYLDKNRRERIIFEDNNYKINNTAIIFSKNDILAELEKYPEKFSPNVIMRPLYQEVILPNLCYIGGGGEIAYWLQLKRYFDSINITFPILLVRNSVLIANTKQDNKREKLQLTWQELFLKTTALENKKVHDLSPFPLTLNAHKELLSNQFEQLYEITKITDESFIGAVKAQEKKQIKGLENLEKRLLKAQKRKLKHEIEQIKTLQNELFPNGNLQERVINFSEIFIEFPEIISKCIKILDPLSNKFEIIVFQ